METYNKNMLFHLLVAITDIQTDKAFIFELLPKFGSLDQVSLEYSNDTNQI